EARTRPAVYRRYRAGTERRDPNTTSSRRAAMDRSRALPRPTPSLAAPRPPPTQQPWTAPARGPPGSGGSTTSCSGYTAGRPKHSAGPSGLDGPGRNERVDLRIASAEVAKELACVLAEQRWGQRRCSRA